MSVLSYWFLVHITSQRSLSKQLPLGILLRAPMCQVYACLLLTAWRMRSEERRIS